MFSIKHAFLFFGLYLQGQDQLREIRVDGGPTVVSVLVNGKRAKNSKMKNRKLKRQESNAMFNELIIRVQSHEIRTKGIIVQIFDMHDSL